MLLNEFARLVRDMRKLQKEFFRTPPKHRPPQLLFDAQDAERAVDRAVDEILGSPGLFDREAGGRP